jgi:hypothetical protein
MTGMEHIANLSIGLAQIQPVLVTDHDARRILTAMLQHQQRIVYHLRNFPLTDYPNYSAHI